MKVIIFSTAYYPHVGGAEVAIKEITDRATNVTFDMVTARLDSKLPCFEHVGNVNVYRVGFGFKHFDKWLLMKWGGWKAYRLHRKNNYDVAWSMMASWGGLAAWWFSVVARKVPLVVTLQEGDEIATRKYGLVALGWYLILSRAKIVSVISNYLGAEARKYGFRGEVVLVPNAVNVKRFEGSGGRTEIRNKLGITDGETVLITTSRLVEKNAVEDIIASMVYLPMNVRLVVAGIGELEQHLKSQIKSLKLESRVIMLGFVSQEDLPGYLHASDIFIRPSLSEGMGISFLEAMAARLPVVATNVGGIPDFLKDGETGLFCEIKNPRSIAEQVKKLMDDENLRRHITEKASVVVSTEYEWENIWGKMKRVLERAANQ